ncbi:MAG: HAD-IB family phosphatase [Acidobacteria bacterium]|nr:HAD-IB family phosphatase [Acidobacteriota bacterium]MBS1864607.1 HAD-IB family phosphatase [Acidobacteriota bacterium]
MNRAAFFDIDGTLTEKPSLELRYFRVLQREGKLGLQNGIAWLAEAARLAAKGPTYVQHGNKAYLRGIRSTGLRANRAADDAPFFPEAVECVARHARNGERIVILTGTLEFLADGIAEKLRAEMLKRNVAAEIHVCATRLEESDGRWTGRLLGQPMFGEAKGIAVWWYAEKWKLNRAECSAYGDSGLDEWMLASVGKPVAANPDSRLRATALRQRWGIVSWAREVRPKKKLAKMVPESAR